MATAISWVDDQRGSSKNRDMYDQYALVGLGLSLVIGSALLTRAEVDHLARTDFGWMEDYSANHGYDALDHGSCSYVFFPILTIGEGYVLQCVFSLKSLISFLQRHSVDKTIINHNKRTKERYEYLILNSPCSDKVVARVTLRSEGHEIAGNP